MLVTSSGITVFEQPANREFVAVSMMALQLERESYTLLSSATVIEVKPLQRLKTALPRLVTLLGICKEVNPSHNLNARTPIVVTPSGMVIEVKLLQAQKAASPILVTPSGI